MSYDATLSHDYRMFPFFSLIVLVFYKNGYAVQKIDIHYKGI